MNTILAVAAGGAIGAAGRHLFNQQMFRLFGPNFPWGTFGVNIIGSLVMGLIVGFFALKFEPSAEIRSFIATGMLGGFTTFSAFSLDAANMIERGQTGIAAVYIGGSVALGLAALFLGLWIARVAFPA
ncbi:MAG: fluoride efflux transporter CrcB [Alphaproteobacteria bacterium HGW-Alphaproteobacteria-12]|nr:MAG: fluoride efflux transporter CrcB [Alphaproteobacteria bacterium HGW-Alphaproteobacteria-12]